MMRQRFGTAGRARRNWLVAGFLAGLGGTAASAEVCGGGVDGSDVPCACGDVVVSSVRLDGDPVVSGAPCRHDGLIVRAPEELRRAIIVDLNGATLRGSGNGVGIRIVGGGPGGARVTSSGA